MQRIHAMWPKGTWLNAGDPMQHYWMQWILCRVVQCISIIEMYAMPLDVIDTDAMQWIPCSVTECTGFHAAVWNASRVNAVDCMRRGVIDPDWMQWIQCSDVKCISSECSGFHEFWQMYPSWMGYIPCSMVQWMPIECSGFHASRFNAVDSMKQCEMHPEWMQWIAWGVG